MTLDVVADAAAALARPKAEPADSFRLHAPLELLARVRLLDRLGGDDDVALAGIAALAERYRADGDDLGERPDVGFADVPSAARALIDAVTTGAVDDAGDAARALADHTGPVDLSLLAGPLALRSLSAAGHASIFFRLLVGTGRQELAATLEPLARELARHPDAVVAVSPTEGVTEVEVDDILGGLASLPSIGRPDPTFIRPLVEQAQTHTEVAATLARLAVPADPTAAGRALLRCAQWSMLGEPDDDVAYGWTHGLTLPAGAITVGALSGQRDLGWQVALAYVAAHRAGLAQRPLREPDSLPSGLDPMDLARRASAHEDAHVAKYTVDCLDLAQVDGDARDLHLAAADRLLAFWGA